MSADVAALLQSYLDWLKAHNLQDGDCLLAAAAEALGENPESVNRLQGSCPPRHPTDESPSPRPSPEGRGSSEGWRLDFPTTSGLPADRRRSSLSLREGRGRGVGL